MTDKINREVFGTTPPKRAIADFPVSPQKYPLRFSIVITCYNQSCFIGEAVNSVMAQAFFDKEIIVVDDASTDGSSQILEKYGDAVKLISLPSNQGANLARNQGAKQAQGEFLVFLDGDDLLLPWALDVYSRVIDLKSPKLILGSMFYFSESFSGTGLGSRPAEIRAIDYAAFMKKDRGCRISASAMVIEQISFRNVGGFTNGIWPAEDHDLLLKLGYAGRTISVVAPLTTAYRVHANNTTRQLPPIIDVLRKLIRREQTGIYPGKGLLRVDRCAVLGGILFYWLKRAYKQKLYAESLKLLAIGWPMVLSAVLCRGIAVVKGRRPIEAWPMVQPE